MPRWHGNKAMDLAACACACMPAERSAENRRGARVRHAATSRGMRNEQGHGAGFTGSLVWLRVRWPLAKPRPQHGHNMRAGFREGRTTVTLGSKAERARRRGPYKKQGWGMGGPRASQKRVHRRLADSRRGVRGGVAAGLTVEREEDSSVRWRVDAGASRGCVGRAATLM